MEFVDRLVPARGLGRQHTPVRRPWSGQGDWTAEPAEDRYTRVLGAYPREVTSFEQS